MDNSPNTARDLREELREDAGRVTSAAADKLQSGANSHKDEAARQAKGLSSALDKTAHELGSDSPDWLRSALQQGARTLDRLARDVEAKDSRALLADVRHIARDHPGTFLAGCAALGFAAARVLKAGGAASGQSSSQAYDPYGQQSESASRSAMSFSDEASNPAPDTAQNVRTAL
jgi:hypothetical protein